MKKSRSVLVSAAVAGLLLGGSTSLTACKASPQMEAQLDRHACKAMNSCKGQGGCKAGDNGCAGKNSCKGKGGCAVPVHH